MSKALQKWRSILSERLKKSDFPQPLEECIASFLTESWMHSETMQKACNLSILELEQMYAEAYSFYEENNYSDGEELFRLLVMLDPFVDKYWLGFGACLQMQGRYAEALKGYGVMATLDEKSPYPFFYASECLEKLNRAQESTEAFNLANKLMTGYNA